MTRKRIKTAPVCNRTADRAILKMRLEAHLKASPNFIFPSPSHLPPKDRRVPLIFETKDKDSAEPYIPFSALLKSINDATIPLPVSPQQWLWLRKFCAPTILRHGFTQAGYQHLQPKTFLSHSVTERTLAKTEMNKANAMFRSKMVPQGAMPITIWFLLAGGFFTSEDAEEGEDPLFLLDEPLEFTSFEEHRAPYWKNCLDISPWIVVWWTCKCVGHVINVTWIWQKVEETEPHLKELKADLQEEILNALIRLIDSCYLNLVDHDVRGDALPPWGSGLSSANSAVNLTIAKLFIDSKHQLSEWPVHSAERLQIRETRDLWDELCKVNGGEGTKAKA